MDRSRNDIHMRIAQNYDSLDMMPYIIEVTFEGNHNSYPDLSLHPNTDNRVLSQGCFEVDLEHYLAIVWQKRIVI